VPISESEIIRVIPGKARQSKVQALSPVTLAASQDLALNIEPGWYRLGGEHIVYCGDTAACSFIDAAPTAKLAIAFTGNDWDHDWLVEQVDNVVVLPQDEFSLEKMEQLILLLSSPRDQVILPWLPHPEILYTAHRLERRVYGGDVDIARCQRSIASSGLSVESLEAAYTTEQAG
ncbi:MAG: site-specific DNA-methyltransferase, partial [Cyanobacteria bacterium J06642_11]